MTLQELRASLALWRRRNTYRQRQLDLAHEFNRKVDIEKWQRLRREAGVNVRRRIEQIKRAEEATAADFRPWMLNGRAGNITDAAKEFIVRALRSGLVVTSTTGGRHAPGSWHYQGKAVDVAGAWEQMIAFQMAEAKHPERFHELFGPENYPWVKEGSFISGAEGSGLENLHDTHVHGALR